MWNSVSWSYRLTIIRNFSVCSCSFTDTCSLGACLVPYLQCSLFILRGVDTLDGYTHLNFARFFASCGWRLRSFCQWNTSYTRRSTTQSCAGRGLYRCFLLMFKKLFLATELHICVFRNFIWVHVCIFEGLACSSKGTAVVILHFDAKH